MNNDYLINKENLMLYKCIHHDSKVEKIIDNIKFNKKIREIDQDKDLLFNKIIKAESFKNLISEFKLNNNKIIDNYYDEIIYFSFSRTNYTFKHIDYYGIVQYPLYIEELKNNSSSNNKITIINDSIFYINYLYENTNNTFIDKEFALNEFFNLFAFIYNKHTDISDEAYNLYKKFHSSAFISTFNKRLLSFYYHSLRK